MSDRTGDDELLDAYGAECPFCGAPAGGPCRTASGKIAARPHADRPAVPYERSPGTDPAAPVVATAFDDLAALVSATDVIDTGDDGAATDDESADPYRAEVPTTHHDPGEESERTTATPATTEVEAPAFVVESDETADLPRIPVGDVRVATGRSRRGGPPSLLDTVRADVAELRIEPIRVALAAAVIAAVYVLVRAIR